jgi:lipopolysaccharide/colanic/teichoic acid biosynthesis glycosyltransferase
MIVPGRLIALVLLILSSPLLLVLAFLVKVTSRGPAFYRQTRVGRGGRHYMMYKLRTMRVDAEKDTGPVWATKNDPRITPLGRFLRATHLDEFPQLLNVVRGEMALIGPRPERPEFVEKLAGKIPGYLDRLTVLPGITGLAQIHLPPDTDLESVRCKLQYDLEYIRRASFGLDLRILLCTALRLFGFPGDLAAHLCAVPRPSLERCPSAGELAAGENTSGNGQAQPTATSTDVVPTHQS